MNNVSKSPASAEKKTAGKLSGAKGGVKASTVKTATSPTTARKPVAAKPVARKAAGKSPAKASPGITEAQRREMIAMAAYLRAEQRGFAGGDPNADWLAAEAEIEQRLMNKS